MRRGSVGVQTPPRARGFIWSQKRTVLFVLVVSIDVSMAIHQEIPIHSHICTISQPLLREVRSSRKLTLSKVITRHLFVPRTFPKTAIATPFGLFEFMRMPFGLKNAAQTFQRLMDSVTNQLSGVFVYLDDVLVASPTVEQHERDLRQLFSALARFGLGLNINKCEFGMREIHFLGHSVSAQGIKPLPGKVRAVRDFERLGLVRALQRFLGMVNFYRRFLPGIAAVLRPLTDALVGEQDS